MRQSRREPDADGRGETGRSGARYGIGPIERARALMTSREATMSSPRIDKRDRSPSQRADAPHARSRRAVLAAAASAAGGIAAAMATSPSANAQAAPAPAADIWSGEYWAIKQRAGAEIRLALYRKRLGAPAPGEASRPVLFLVHGSSISARPSFDLSVPGHGEYSMMNVFAGYGFDVWTMDHDGYGRSGSSGNSSDIASGVQDLKAAMPIVLQETGQQKLHLYGTSSGAIRAGAYAQAAPERVDRLVLSAFTYKGTGSPEIARRLAVADRYRDNPRRTRDLKM